MAYKTTFIKIDRNITEWRWYHDANTFRVFVHLLLKANIKDHDFENITVYRGELVTSRKNLAMQLGLTEQQIRTALEHLKSTGEITSKSYSKFTVISIKKYDEYQSVNQQITSNQPAINQQITSNQPQSKNEKNEKNEKNGRNISGEFSPEPPTEPELSTKQEKKSDSVKLSGIISQYTDDTGLKEALADFIKMRNKIKKPLTERALRTCLKKLSELSADDMVRTAIVDQSIEHCWQSFYQLKGGGGDASSIPDYIQPKGIV